MVEATHRQRFEAELTQMLRANERNLGRVTLVVAAIGALAALYMTRFDRWLGVGFFALALLFAAHAGLLVPRLLAGAHSLRRIQTVNVTLEVSVALLISLVDLHVLGARYAWTSTPAYFVFIAVIASGLRWRPALAVYAGVLGAVQQALLYLLCLGELGPAQVADLPSLSWGHAAQRVALVLTAGVLAGVLARTGRAIAWRVAGSLVEEERVRHLFGEYVSEQALALALGGDLALAGERRDVTVLFADIRGFTSMSAAVAPEVVVDYLNRYFDRVCRAVAAHGGMVNKFMGDGLLAVFGAPAADPAHARHALHAARALVEAAAEVLQPGGASTRVGVGLHTGPLVLGSVGSAQHRDYTVVGDTVNLASRIEGLTRELGRSILFSDDTARAAGALDEERLGEFAVKGRHQPVQLYALRDVP